MPEHWSRLGWNNTCCLSTMAMTNGGSPSLFCRARTSYGRMFDGKVTDRVKIQASYERCKSLRFTRKETVMQHVRRQGILDPKGLLTPGSVLSAILIGGIVVLLAGQSAYTQVGQEANKALVGAT